MNTQNLKEKFDAIRNSPTTKQVLRAGGEIAVAVATTIAVKAVVYIVVAGTKALVSEINNNVNKKNN